MKNTSKRPIQLRGGIAIPLKKDMYYIKGRKHTQGGVDVNPDLEVEGGEVVEQKPKEIKVYSSVKFLGGNSPAELVMNGFPKDKVFNAQQRYKKVNKINDDGTKKAQWGVEKRDNTYVAPITEQKVIPAKGATKVMQDVRNTITRDGQIKSGAVDIVSPEFDLLTGIRGITNQIVKELPIRKGSHYRVVGKSAIDDANKTGVIRHKYVPSEREQFLLDKRAKGEHLSIAEKMEMRGTASGGVPYFAKEGVYIPDKTKFIIEGNDKLTNFVRIGPNGQLNKYGLPNIMKPHSSSTPYINGQFNTAPTKDFTYWEHKPFWGWREHKFDTKRMGGLSHSKVYRKYPELKNKAKMGNYILQTNKGNNVRFVPSTGNEKRIARYGTSDTIYVRKPEELNTMFNDTIYEDDNSIENINKYKNIRKDKKGRTIIKMDSLTIPSNTKGIHVLSKEDIDNINNDTIYEDDSNSIITPMNGIIDMRTKKGYNTKSKNTLPQTEDFANRLKNVSKNTAADYLENNEFKFVGIPKKNNTNKSNNTNTDKFNNSDNRKPQFYAERRKGLFEDGESIKRGLIRAGWSHGTNPDVSVDIAKVPTINKNKNSSTKKYAPKNPVKVNKNNLFIPENTINSGIKNIVPKVQYNRNIVDNSAINNPINLERQSTEPTKGQKFKYKVKKFFKNKENVEDAIGLGANVIGSVSDLIINNKMLNDLKAPNQPFAKRATKLVTTENTNAQEAKLREEAKSAERQILNNTDSSRKALARLNRVRLANIMDYNTIRERKSNIERDLINRDRLNQQAVAHQNVDSYNAWRDKVTEFDNSVREMKADNKVAFTSNINKAVQDTLDKREKRKQFRNNIRAYYAAHPNVNKKYLKHYGLELD